ncbi:hypothetical protein, partial [Arsenophonus sp.]|uniref:hypothetical protein n=1 Tax=Arsenophonus sp. TaxID=1872640 RepID=UPI0028629123
YLEEKFCGSGNIHTPDYNGRRLLRTAIYLQRLSSRRRRATVQYKKDILFMRSKGYSYQQIVDYLKDKELIVSISTVRKFLSSQ